MNIKKVCTCHPIKQRRIGIEKMIDGILKITTKNIKRHAWNATASNERFGVMGAEVRRKCDRNRHYVRCNFGVVP